MLKRIAVPVLLLCLAPGARAADAPGRPVELRNYTGTAQERAASTRLRISIAGEAGQDRRAVRVGDLLLCAAAGCYRARTDGKVDIADTSAGKAARIADVAIPPATITDVHFPEVRGTAVITGHLKLDTPLALGRDTPGVELMLAVRQRQQAGRAVYVPVASAHVGFADDSELVHYLPSTRTLARLSLGTTLTLPARALDRAQIFNVGIARTGELFPRVDIFPYLVLKQPGMLEVRAVGGGQGGQGGQALAVPAGPAAHRHARPAPDPGAMQRSARVTLWRTAVIEPAELEKSQPAPRQD